MDTRTAYPRDLAHAEWAQVCRVIPAPKPGGRPSKHDRREGETAGCHDVQGNPVPMAGRADVRLAGPLASLEQG